MAVDGRRFTSTKGSDDFHDFPCSPCSKEGKNVAAVKHCMDCDENLCTSCICYHNRFSAMKGHQILDKVKSSSGQRPQLPSQRCTKHGGRLIDVFCPNHDTVCCSTCIAVEHSSCHGIKFIPDNAKGISKSKEVQQFEEDMKDLQSRYLSLIQREDVELQALRTEKERVCKEIRALRKKIKEYFDRMEQKLLNELDTKFKQRKQNTDIDRKETEEVLAEIQSSNHQLQEAKQGNESELFAVLKSGRKKIKENFDIAEKLERSRKAWRLDLQTDRTLLEILNENYGMAHLTESFGSVAVSFLGAYDIRTKDDKADCDVCNFCMTNEGFIILTDLSNKRLKRLNNAYNIVSCLDLPDGPFGICQISDTRFAVTLINQKRVQFVRNTNSMKLQTSFSVGDRCRSLKHINELLYVCCGGSETKKEGPGHLEIYNIDGRLLRSVFDSLACPCYLDMFNNGREIYVSDVNNGLVVFDRNGNVLFCYQDREKKGSGGIYRLTDNNLFLALFESNKIVVVANDGGQQQEIITEEDRVIMPKALCYDSKHSRLIVSMFGIPNEIKVFQMEHYSALFTKMLL